MKKLISLFVAFVLMLSACALCACDLGDTDVIDAGDTSEVTTSEETTDTTGDNSQPAPEPVKVDSVNGMNARQLLEAYMAIFDDPKNLDMSGTVAETEDGTTVNTTISMKIGTDAMYIHMNEDGDVTEVTVIDSVGYYNVYGTKIKKTNVSVDELIDEMISAATGEIADEKVDSAVIYSLGGEYYIDIQLSDEESESIGYEKKEHKLRCYFDAEGKIKRTLVTRDGYTETTVYNSIGKAITISAPDDADLYHALGDVDPELYEKYEDLVEVIGNSNEFLMRIELTGMIESYKIDAEGNEWVSVVDEYDDRTDMWSVDGKGYVLSKGQTFEVDAINVVSSIQNLANLRNVVSEKIPTSNMAELALVESDDENVLSFYSVGYYYSFTYDSEMSEINIVITEDGSTETVKYFFEFYDGQQTKIEAPEVG